LSGGGNTDPLLENAGEGWFDGSTVAIVVEGKEGERVRADGFSDTRDRGGGYMEIPVGGVHVYESKLPGA
jgi:hypothetical protein